MGLYNKYVDRYGASAVKQATNVEFVLKKIDEAEAASAAANIALSDADESDTLPSTGLIATILQTIRNNLKWLFNIKANACSLTELNKVENAVNAENAASAASALNALNALNAVNATSATNASNLIGFDIENNMVFSGNCKNGVATDCQIVDPASFSLSISGNKITLNSKGKWTANNCSNCSGGQSQSPT